MCNIIIQSYIWLSLADVVTMLNFFIMSIVGLTHKLTGGLLVRP